jgi:hypothetical protein
LEERDLGEGFAGKIHAIGDPRRGVEISPRYRDEIGVADVVFASPLEGMTSAANHFPPLENGDFAGVSAVAVFRWFWVFHWGFVGGFSL